MERSVFHVTYDSKCKDWVVKKENSNRSLAREASKVAAVKAAKVAAKKAKLGQVIIHTKDGKIQTEYTYGKDPVATKG